MTERVSFLVGPAPAAPKAHKPAAPVGVVAASYADAWAFVDQGGRMEDGFVLITRAVDVPRRLGGMALLMEDMPVDLRDALVKAMGI